MPQPIASACAAGDKVYVLNRQFEEVLDVPWNKAALYAEVCSFIMPTTPGAEVYLGTFSKYGDGDGELIWPVGIAIDSDENIYIADEWMNRISIFTNSGHFLRNWSTQGDGEFNRTSGIAFDLNDDVYVADSLNHRVRKFTKDGEYILQFGSFGDGPGELNAPWGVAVDDEGSVYVADHKNHRVQKFDANGEFVASLAVTARVGGSSTAPAMLPLTRMVMCMSATGAMTACKSSPPTAGLSPASSGTRSNSLKDTSSRWTPTRMSSRRAAVHTRSNRNGASPCQQA